MHPMQQALPSRPAVPVLPRAAPLPQLHLHELLVPVQESPPRERTLRTLWKEGDQVSFVSDASLSYWSGYMKGQKPAPADFDIRDMARELLKLRRLRDRLLNFASLLADLTKEEAGE